MTKYPYLKDELHRLSTMFTVREARFKERLQENEGKVFDFGYQLACEKPKVERQAAELAEEKKKREEMESSLANEKKAHAATLTALSAERSEKAKFSAEKETRYLGAIAKLESRVNVLRATAQSTEKEVKRLNIINNIPRPQIYKLRRIWTVWRVRTIASGGKGKEVLGEDCQVGRAGEQLGGGEQVTRRGLRGCDEEGRRDQVEDGDNDTGMGSSSLRDSNLEIERCCRDARRERFRDKD